MKKLVLVLVAICLNVNLFANGIQILQHDLLNENEEPTVYITKTESTDKGVNVYYKVESKNYYDVTVKICVIGSDLRKMLNLEPCITHTCKLYGDGKYVGTGCVFFPCNTTSGLSMNDLRCGMSDFSIKITNY